MSADEIATRRDPIRLIMAGLVIWGLYVAVGVTGLGVQSSLFDPRKSLIVVVAVGLFLGLWGLALLAAKKRSAPAAHASRWSKPGITSLGLVLLGFVVWQVAIAAWQQATTRTVTILGWLAALSMLASLVAALIGLSDPQSRRGKLLGLITMAFVGLAITGFFARMSGAR